MWCFAWRWCRASAAMAPQPRRRSRWCSKPCCCSGSYGSGWACTCWRLARAVPRARRSNWKICVGVIPFLMTTTDLKNLLQRVETWPEEAQDELIAVAKQIESELQGRDYFATREELQIIDDAIASIDGGEVATDLEIKTAFAKFRSA